MTPRTLILIALLCLPALGLAEDAHPAYTVRMIDLGPVPDATRILKETIRRDGRSVIWLVADGAGQALVFNGHADPTFSVIKSGPVVSPDGARLAYKIDVEGGAKRALVVDGKAGPSFDQVNNDSILFSPDGKSISYSAQRDGKTALVRDGQVIAEGSNIKSDAVFSPDFRRVAYKVDAGGDKRAVVLDGIQGPAFPQIDNSSMAFSRDGRHFVYLVTEGWGSTAKATVVLDGVPGETYEQVTGLAFSPDSAHLAYIASRSGKECVVLDGKPGLPYDAIDPFFVRFTPDGRLGYRAVSGARMFLVLDGKAADECEGIFDWGTSANGKGLAYVVRTGEFWSVVFNGAKGEGFTAVPAPPALSPDGLQLAYAAQKGDRWIIVKDRQASAAWEQIGQYPTFSADGSHWGYIAQRSDKWLVVVDGEENGPFDWFTWDGLRFSPDGKRSAFAARKGDRWIICVDGKVMTGGDEAAGPPKFSADSRHFACMVRQGAQWRLILDGEPGPLFDRMFGNVPDFAPDGSLEYLAVKGNRLVRVEHVPGSAPQ